MLKTVFEGLSTEQLLGVRACPYSCSELVSSKIDKKLSYRRETARQLCKFFSARSVIVHCSLNTAPVVQLG